MSSIMDRHISQRRRRLHRRRIALVCGATAVAVMLVALLLWAVLHRPADKPAPESSAPAPSTSTTQSTTTGATTGSSIATLPPTTSLKATTTKATTTKATTASDGRLDANGLLQYNTAGHYVQATSSADGSAVPWNLLLVNDWNGISQSYADTIKLKTIGSQKCDERVYDAMTAMFKAGAEHNIGAQSGYRAYSKQDTLYWRQVKRYTDQGYDNIRAQEVAGTIVKRPGFSEHNTGLAVDVYGSNNYSLEQSFANTKAYAWLIEHCAEYGFILRFPKGKEDITGVIYEPWHYRYVGVEAATYIMEHGLCLEEYLEQMHQ